MLKKNQVINMMMLYAKIMSLTMKAKHHETIFHGVKMPMVYNQLLKAPSCSLRRPSNKKTLVKNNATPPRRLNTLDMTRRPRTEIAGKVDFTEKIVKIRENYFNSP